MSSNFRSLTWKNKIVKVVNLIDEIKIMVVFQNFNRIYYNNFEINNVILYNLFVLGPLLNYCKMTIILI